MPLKLTRTPTPTTTPSATELAPERRDVMVSLTPALHARLSRLSSARGETMRALVGEWLMLAEQRDASLLASYDRAHAALVRARADAR